MQLLDLGRIDLRLGASPAALEDVRGPIQQSPLPLVDHRRVNTKPCRQLGNRLLTLQSLKGYPRLELRLVLLACRHR